MAARQSILGTVTCAAVALLLGGCGDAQILRKIPFTPAAIQARHEQVTEEEARYRRRLQESADPEALRWLLANRIQQGTSLEEVNATLGLDGERVYEDGWIKRGNSHLLQTDECYKWGPDRDGNTVYLFFRDNRLVHFDPHEYR